MGIGYALIGLTMIFASTTGRAADWQRWTGAEDDRADLHHVLKRLSGLNGYALTSSDFVLGEERTLATSHYRRYDQVRKGLRIKGMAVRLWTKPKGDGLIQLEARTEGPETTPVGVLEINEATGTAAVARATRTARAAIATSVDRSVRSLASETVWQRGRVVTIITANGRRGVHTVEVDALTGEILRRHYAPRASADPGIGARQEELSVPALVYPVYEEYRGDLLKRRPARLKYIRADVAKPDQDPFETLRSRRYLFKMHDLLRAEDPADRSLGFWSLPWLRREVESLRRALPLVPNRFADGGVLLKGRYATINLHPDALQALSEAPQRQRVSEVAFYRWREVADEDDWEIVPEATLPGKPLLQRDDAWRRDATRHPTHDTAAYIKSGFDEVQVYYAINTLFDTLRPMGFRDPDFGDRPFHAILFDPDIESKDNAFYSDDTINFTTYSPGELNMARDNTTIWHELGHGVMERLMGDRLELADTGGLSEGMADFVAELVLQAATDDQPFPGKEEQRIINATGFHLTNEVHDDGEAYGGAMKTILDLSRARFGRQGLHMVTDLVLEAMRLCRDHPELTAEEWFDHLRFADALGRPGVRRPAELAGVIDDALASRNFAPEDERGRFALSLAGRELDAEGPGSRDNEIEVELAAGDTATYELEAEVVDGARFKFQWPVEIRVFYESGPLQGAIDWIGEDTEPLVLTLAHSGDRVRIPLTVRGACDAVNRTDGSCSDFAYLQVWNHGATKAVAKKRVYLKVKPL